MVLWIGVDDTDSLRGMCTTFLATEFVRELTQDLDLIGYPRLVRLNPNIPWKTRGNGAIALAVGNGRGRSFPAGVIDGRPVVAFPNGDVACEPKEVLERLAVLVERWADIDAEGTDPGLVVLARKPPPRLYWRAVRSIVCRSEAERALRGRGERRAWKSGRGLIGAAAACAWRPHDRTWEVLAYREASRWGTPREIDDESVRAMDSQFPSTFNNYDYENNRVVIAPKTPCPVLFGIRGDCPRDLPIALASIRWERPDRWLLFLTNQGTDDHVRRTGRLLPRSAGRFAGVITRAPRTLRGGHVVFGIGEREVTAYEPAKQFREIVRALVPGDIVEVIGSVRESPRTVNLEKLRIVSLHPLRIKVANPVCPTCRTQMKSSGHEARFRCRRCGRTAARSRAVYAVVSRGLFQTWYEPPVGSRRHLSKPLKRGLPG